MDEHILVLCGSKKMVILQMLLIGIQKLAEILSSFSLCTLSTDDHILVLGGKGGCTVDIMQIMRRYSKDYSS